MEVTAGIERKIDSDSDSRADTRGTAGLISDMSILDNSSEEKNSRAVKEVTAELVSSISSSVESKNRSRADTWNTAGVNKRIRISRREF